MAEKTEIDVLLNLLPKTLSNSIKKLAQDNPEQSLENVVEIIIDLDRHPVVRYLDGTKEFPRLTEIFDNVTIRQSDLDSAVKQLPELKEDNRTGIDKTLHRISALVDRYGEITGLTLRVGRDIKNSEWAIVDLLESRSSILLVGLPGAGKCLGKDTPILMYDGTIKMVQDVVRGDQLIGPDSKPRNVLSTCSGQEELYRVTPTKGDSYVVNKSHILSLRHSANSWNSGQKRHLNKTFFNGSLHNLSVTEYLSLSKGKKIKLKGWRSGVDFEYNTTPLDPYFLGLWLGDGGTVRTCITTMDNEIVDYIYEFSKSINLKVNCLPNKTSNKSSTYDINSGLPPLDRPHGCNFLKNKLVELNVWDNKHIPLCYKANTRQIRLQLLAGLLDSDGYMNSGVYDFTLKCKQLAEDLVYLCRSLGFAAYLKPCLKSCIYKGEKREGTYYRVSVSGDLSEVPVKLERKKAEPRKQVKDVLRTGIKVEPIGVGDYYGFEIDGDHLFLLGDFTVTHNTTSIRGAARLSADCLNRRTIIVDESDEIAGMGKTPHPCVGMARKLSVPFGRTQADMLLQAVANHTPEVLLADEVGNFSDVKAILGVANRGVQIIATAHGSDLNSVLRNPDLCKLLGGISTVTLTDHAATQRGSSKSVMERQYDPAFDVVIILRSHSHVLVYKNISDVIDSFLNGDIVEPEERVLDQEEGVFKILHTQRTIVKKSKDNTFSEQKTYPDTRKPLETAFKEIKDNSFKRGKK